MSGFKAVGNRVYSAEGALVRSFEWHPLRWPDNDAAVADLHRCRRKAKGFVAALNGAGPRAERARRDAQG